MVVYVKLYGHKSWAADQPLGERKLFSELAWSACTEKCLVNLIGIQKRNLTSRVNAFYSCQSTWEQLVMHGMIVYVCWLVLCFYRSVAFSRLLRVKMACVSSSDSRAIEYVKKENPQLSYDFQ